MSRALHQASLLQLCVCRTGLVKLSRTFRATHQLVLVFALAGEREGVDVFGLMQRLYG